MRKLTIREVAKKAGVSVATVSRALNSGSRNLVKPTTLKKIEKITKSMGYLPHRAASSLRKGRTETIGMLNFNVQALSGYVKEIIEGVFKGLEEIGYDLKFILGKEFYSLPAVLDNAGIDGIILTHAYQKTFPSLEKEITRNKSKIWPLIVINDYNPSWQINQFYVDSYKASQKMIMYLLRKGYRKFYLIGGEEGSNDAQARKQAFLDVLRKRNVKFRKENIFNGHFSEEGGYQAGRAILGKDKSFRGVFYCLNDAMAIGALRAINESGLRCPEDVKLVGFDGIPQTEFASPSITTMKFPLSEMGYQAVKAVHKIIQGKARRYIRKEFDCELIIRESS